MASEAETLPSDAVIDDAEFGFERQEMYQSNLSGSVDPYDRHVFLCYKSPESWPSNVENSDDHLLPMLLSVALKSRKSDINCKVRLTICEARDGTDLSEGDVLIFPEMIKYSGLTESDVDSFVEDVLVNDKPWSSGVQEALTGSRVFVCSHNSRDRRCGVCGPALIAQFKEDIESRGLNNQVHVTACSHVGGHKYAGNLIIFSANTEGKVAGHWYGYVTPKDVPDLLDQHIGKGEIIDRLWRGQMGAPVKEVEKEEEQKLPNGNDVTDNVKLGDRSLQDAKESVVSCCQGTNGVSCCRDENSDEKEDKRVEEAKGCSRLSSWMGKWEQADVYAAIAVVGAVATVAVAYSFYRRSG